MHMKKRLFWTTVLAMAMMVTTCLSPFSTVKAQTVAQAKSTLTTYKKQLKSIKADIKNEKLGSSYSRRRQQYYDFEDRLEAVDRKIDRLDDMWESDYRAGRVTRNAYHNVEYKIESVENYMDTVENYLERKFNYEFDD